MDYHAAVARAPEDGGPPSPPLRDPGMVTMVPVSEGGPVSAGDGGFPLLGVRNPAVQQCELADTQAPPFPSPTPVTVESAPSRWDTLCQLLLPCNTAPPAPTAVPAVPAAQYVPPPQPELSDPSTSWAVTVTTAEATGELVPVPSAMPVWARPVLNFRHITTVLHTHWREGIGACPRLAQRLFEEFNPQDACLGELEQLLYGMVFSRADVSGRAVQWLESRMAAPDADPCAILTDLLAWLRPMSNP